jgi:hypothetical protein
MCDLFHWNHVFWGLASFVCGMIFQSAMVNFIAMYKGKGHAK